jgi:GMP synthase PP-ATPase subunit
MLRAARTTDFMTAHWARIVHPQLAARTLAIVLA